MSELAELIERRALLLATSNGRDRQTKHREFLEALNRLREAASNHAHAYEVRGKALSIAGFLEHVYG